MTIIKYLDAIERAEEKIKDGKTQLVHNFKERREIICSRYTQIKISIQYQLSLLRRMEESPNHCLTVAMSSYLLLVDAVFYLEAPDELQDLLSCRTIIWLYDNLEKQAQAEKMQLQI